LFFGFVAFAVTQIERTFSRLMRLFTGAEFRSDRVQLWKDAFWGFFDAPIFGHGLSNSGAVINFNYPHNLYLQIMVDGGLIALILLAFISIYPLVIFYNAYKKQLLKSHVWIPLLSCYVFYLINYLLATNFYEGRILIALGLIIVLIVHNETSKAGS
jgi:O-antigen ligase